MTISNYVIALRITAFAVNQLVPVLRFTVADIVADMNRNGS